MGVGRLIKNPITTDQKAIANGIATLDSSAKVPKTQISLTPADVGAIANTGNEVLTVLNATSGLISSNLIPGSVDETLEFANLASFPAIGQSSKIYVALNTQKSYRWSGSIYVDISSGGTADTALKLSNIRTITGTGDVLYSVNFDGSSDVNGAMLLSEVNASPGSFGNTSQSVSITVDAKGRVTEISNNNIAVSWASLTAKPADLFGLGVTSSDVLNTLNLANGTISTSLLGSELTAFQALPDTVGFIKKIGDGAYSIDASTYLTTETDPTVSSFTKGLTSNASILAAVNASTGTISASRLPVPDTANRLTTSRTISTTGDATYSVNFDGSANVSGAMELATVNANTGIFGSATATPVITVDAKGRITAISTAVMTPDWTVITSKPTTLSGFGITDAQPLGNELTALQNLVDTAGFLRKAGDGAYSIDTNTYLTTNQSITVSGDASGSGSTAIALTLTLSGVTAGTYNNSATQVRPFTVDAKGRITGVGTGVDITPPWAAITSKPTTLSGFGITDAQPLGNELTALQSLVDTVGFIRKTGDGTYLIDTNTYLLATGNAVTAARLATARTISTTGDATYSVSFDGSANVSGAITLTNVAETPGTFPKVTFNSKGLITGGTTLIASDIPSLDWEKITSFTGGNILPTMKGGTGSAGFPGNRIIISDFSTSSQLQWDNINKRLGVGTGTPLYPLDIFGAARISGQILFTNNTASTSKTTGCAVFYGGAGFSGAIYASSFNGDGSEISGLNASNITSGNMSYLRFNPNEVTLPLSTASVPNDSICLMASTTAAGYPITGTILSAVFNQDRGIQFLNSNNGMTIYSRSRHSSFTDGWSPWYRMLLEISNSIRTSGSKTPDSASAVGSLGELCWDANYMYVCVAANTWKRTALTTW